MGEIERMTGVAGENGGQKHGPRGRSGRWQPLCAPGLSGREGSSWWWGLGAWCLWVSGLRGRDRRRRARLQRALFPTQSVGDEEPTDGPCPPRLTFPTTGHMTHTILSSTARPSVSCRV